MAPYGSLWLPMSSYVSLWHAMVSSGKSEHFSFNSQGTPGSGGIPQIWGNLKNQIWGNPQDMGKWQILFSLFERERTLSMSYNYSWTLLDQMLINFG